MGKGDRGPSRGRGDVGPFVAQERGHQHRRALVPDAGAPGTRRGLQEGGGQWQLNPPARGHRAVTVPTPQCPTCSAPTSPGAGPSTRKAVGTPRRATIALRPRPPRARPSLRCATIARRSSALSASSPSPARASAVGAATLAGRQPGAGAARPARPSSSSRPLARAGRSPSTNVTAVGQGPLASKGAKIYSNPPVFRRDRSHQPGGDRPPGLIADKTLERPAPRLAGQGAALSP